MTLEEWAPDDEGNDVVAQNPAYGRLAQTCLRHTCEGGPEVFS